MCSLAASSNWASGSSLASRLPSIVLMLLVAAAWGLALPAHGAAINIRTVLANLDNSVTAPSGAAASRAMRGSGRLPMAPAYGIGAAVADLAATDPGDYVFANGFEAGHVVVLGYDFDTGGAALRPEQIDMGAAKILGNAVFLSPATAFARPINVLLVNPLAGASPTSIANVEQAICTRVAARFADAGQPRTCDCAHANACVNYQSVIVESSDPAAALGAVLPGNDVAVMLNDQDSGALSDTIGTTIGSLLIDFVNGGGIVIGLGGVTPVNTPSHSLRVLSGLLDIVPADSAPDPATTTAQRDCASDDPLAYDAAGAFINYFAEPAASVRFVTSDRHATEVYASPHSASCTSGCNDWQSMVIHKPYPDVDQASGPITIHSFTDGQATDASFCASDSTSKFCPWAAFYDANGALVARCPLRGDGTAHRDFASGTIALVTSVSSSGSGDHDQVRAAYGLQPYDNVTLGQTRHPSTGSFPVNATVQADVPGSAFFFLTTGCSFDGQITFDGTTTMPLNLSADSSCLHFDESDNPLLNVLVTANDINDKVIAYAYVPDIPLTLPPGVQFNVDVQISDWKTSISSISPAVVGSIPPNTTQFFFGLLAGTGVRPLYEELPNSASPFLLRFRLTAPNSALTAFVGVTWHQQVQFAVGQETYAPFVIQETDQSPLATSWVVNSSAFLGRITALAPSGSAPPRVRWTGTNDTQQQLISTANVGMWLFDAGTPLACANSGQNSGQVQWLVTFPAHGAPGIIGCTGGNSCLQFDASGNSGDIQIPTLPDDPPFDCFKPLTAPITYAIGFHKDLLLGDAGLRQDAENNVRPRVAQIMNQCGSFFEDDFENENNFPQYALAPTATTNTSVVVDCFNQ